MSTQGAWRTRYGCADMSCRRNRVFGRLYCPEHDRSDEQIRREQWVREHAGEQLPCVRCWHRRVFHTMLVLTSSGLGERQPRGAAEAMCRCSIPDCTCTEYEPI